MTRWIVPLAVLCLCGAAATPAHAQASGDPFFLYYGYYLPQQAFFASVPKQEDNLRMMAMQRQMTAFTDRAMLNDPAGLGTYDPLRPFGERGTARMVHPAPDGVVCTHKNGSGPTGYYNRTNTHFPGRRIGQMTSRTGGAVPDPASRFAPRFGALGTTQRGGGGMGGMGMGGMGGFQ